MDTIDRTILHCLETEFFKGKALIVMGHRQSGKTTLVNMLLDKYPQKRILYFNADDSYTRNLLSNASTAQIMSIVGKSEIVIIDEAQRIQNIGLAIKIMVDQIKTAQVIATGSSSFDLANKIKEPLTGRKFEYTLFPLSYSEMVSAHGFWEEQRLLEQRVVYGYYPEVVTSPGNEEKLLREIADSYLYKDIFTLEQINKPILLDNLVRALAFQVSNELSYNDLSQLVGADRATVEKYLDLLEKAYIVFRLPALHRNVRNEIKKGKKFYFWDNGILNAILGNFNPLSSRSDAGVLWENFVVSERIKFIKNSQGYTRFYFWRTALQQEIDLIEEAAGEFSAYEIKLSLHKKNQIPRTFTAAYPIKDQRVINKDNFHEFVTSPQLA